MAALYSFPHTLCTRLAVSLEPVETRGRTPQDERKRPRGALTGASG